MAAPTVPVGTHSHNTKLYTWVSSAFVAFGLIKSISGPKGKGGVSKATTLTSPSATQEKLPGLWDEGSYSMTCIFKAADMTTIRGWIRVMQSFQIQAPDGTGASTGSTWQFSGFITELGEEFPEDDLITVDCTFEISGPITFAVAT